VRYGFMDHPDVPRVLARAQAQGLEPLAEPVTFYVGRVSLRFQTGHAWTLWARRLFGLMQRNAHPTTAHFRLPPGKVMELGSQVEL
jgi:KUP system potassium uptake protein